MMDFSGTDLGFRSHYSDLEREACKIARSKELRVAIGGLSGSFLARLLGLTQKLDREVVPPRLTRDLRAAGRHG